LFFFELVLLVRIGAGLVVEKMDATGDWLALLLTMLVMTIGFHVLFNAVAGLAIVVKSLAPQTERIPRRDFAGASSDRRAPLTALLIRLNPRGRRR